MLSRREALLAGIASGLLGSAARAAEQVAWPSYPAEEIELWPGVPPGAPSTLPTEELIETGSAGNHGRLVKGIARPRMKVFRPARPNGAALKAAGVSVETHLFAAGGHGFGLPGPGGEAAQRWKEMFVGWARTQGLG